MRKLLATFIVFASLSFAALPAGTVWEVRSLGSNNNSGCFSTGGTDYSQQDAAQYNFTDLVIDGADNTKVTSASHNFVAADVGNCMNVTAGTGFTVGRYHINSVAANAATLDRAVGTTGSTGGTYFVGGAVATVITATSTATSGNKVWVKADGTYSVTAQTTFANVAIMVVAGYTTTRGDDGQATIQVASGAFRVFALSNSAHDGFVVKNFIIDCNSVTSTGAVQNTSGQVLMQNVKAMNCENNAFDFTGGTSPTCIDCLVTGQVNNIAFNLAANGTICRNCRALDPTSAADAVFQLGNATGVVCSGCIGEGHASASAADVFSVTASGPVKQIINSVCYNAGRDCIRDVCTAACNHFFQNNILYTAVGKCINFTAATEIAVAYADYNAVSCAGGNYAGISAGAHDVTLSADPFVAAASNNFAPNNTTGGGHSVRNTGFPGATTGGTGYMDIGAFQTQGGAQAVYGYAK